LKPCLNFRLEVFKTFYPEKFVAILKIAVTLFSETTKQNHTDL